MFSYPKYNRSMENFIFDNLLVRRSTSIEKLIMVAVQVCVSKKLLDNEIFSYDTLIRVPFSFDWLE